MQSDDDSEAEGDDSENDADFPDDEGMDDEDDVLSDDNVEEEADEDDEEEGVDDDSGEDGSDTGSPEGTGQETSAVDESGGETWEDIYGRTRAKDGRILAGGIEPAARYVPPALRKQAALQQPDEKKRKELERLKKQVSYIF